MLGEGRLDYVEVEVVPRRIGLLDESDFPGTLPFLESVLAGDGGFHSGVSLVPDEAVYVVSLGESVGEVILVLPDALDEVGGDACVDGAVKSAGEDVYARLLHGWGMVADGWEEGGWIAGM